jgi:hypothetical protein
MQSFQSITLLWILLRFQNSDGMASASDGTFQRGWQFRLRPISS